MLLMPCVAMVMVVFVITAFFATHSSGHHSICRQCDGGMKNVFKISFLTIEEDSLGSS